MKKLGIIIVFILAVAALSSCGSTGGCASVEKQEINTNQTEVTLSTEVAE